MTDEELREGYSKIFASLIHCDSQRRNAKQAVTKTVKHAVSGTRVSFLPVYKRQNQRGTAKTR